MRLSVIIVSYNVRYYLEQCLRSLIRATEGIAMEIFVVDNHSRDGSAEFISERFTNVNVISMAHNSGFAAANNVAIRQSTGEYVLLLNPDTIVAENTIRESVAFMDSHPEAGAHGVRMLKANGENALESRRGLPTPMTAFYKMCGLCARYPDSKQFGRYYMSNLPWDKPSEIEIISGAYCMLRRKALDEIGLLDEDFFMYGEDIDLSYRLLKGGYKNWYIPSAILHYKGESTQQSSFRYVHVFYEAMLIFFKKHFSNIGFLLSIPIKLAIYAKATVALIKTQLTRIKKGLGFFSKRRKEEELYVFVGNKEMIESCQAIARRNGLSATFNETDAETYKGHDDNDFNHVDVVYVVYDVGTFSYESTFEYFSKSPRQNVFIGTYDTKTGVVITPDDIYK